MRPRTFAPNFELYAAWLDSDARTASGAAARNITANASLYRPRSHNMRGSTPKWIEVGCRRRALPKQKNFATIHSLKAIVQRFNKVLPYVTLSIVRQVLIPVLDFNFALPPHFSQ